MYAGLKRGVLCPERGVLCPKRGMLCPERGVLCPERDVLCPERGVLCRERGILLGTFGGEGEGILFMHASYHNSDFKNCWRQRNPGMTGMVHSAVACIVINAPFPLGRFRMKMKNTFVKKEKPSLHVPVQFQLAKRYMCVYVWVLECTSTCTCGY